MGSKKSSPSPPPPLPPSSSGADDDSEGPSSSSATTINDPVYGQPQSVSSTPSYSPAPGPGIGQTPPSDDPVSAQPQSSNSSAASNRLNQLTSQISPPQAEPQQPNTKRARKPKSSKDPSSDLPADYSDILTHLTTLRTIATTPDTSSRGYIRQKTSGKLWSRERIATLLDPQTWREVGSVTGTVTWEKDSVNPQAEHVRAFTPSNNPQGFGRVTCPRTGLKRQIYLTSDDFSVRAGHADGSVAIKTLYGEKLALRLKVPVVKLVDGSSGGGSVSTIMTQGYSYMPHVTVLSTVIKQLNMGIPNIGAVLGPAIGLGAARVVATHFSVMAADIGSLFNAGPKVVEGATFEEGLSFSDLGGPNVHCTNGTIDNLAANEKECFDQIRTVLGYLPQCGQFQAPPIIASDDPVDREDLSLRSIIPRKKSRMYNPYTIILSVVDKGSWFEIGALWGRTGITGLARLGGRPVGILSLNCEVNSGALDAIGSQKLMKMLKFCDVFNLPVVQFVDVPGYAIGTVAERTATMKWGVELGKAYYSTTTPIFSVVTRRVYGVAGGIMLDSREPWMRIAWPSGNWGSLPLDGGIEVGHRFELKMVREKEGEEGWKRRYKELEDEYIRLMNPVRTATCFNVEEIVDPKDTRKICCRWIKEMYGLPMQERLADRASGKLHAVFT
ncbi:propionyl-CoA carboxylase beta chain [Cladophialophora psammophila CBS 110553]|uniref:Propionyl-CoA carboxylase beta chain, mitochondrial n=1 Tax=Cladophialophora psammophila CBS 110553 TaxID=1182543 RepID=W9X7R9_9EURO|nr:propionyl-CoA carboxylase beta chain [Cladophialophora psammophila CBS 110553]EXJ72961.1 propionyl-CoA carboxylase beta chain [Cladophialophora psammophila CBS 110553]